ncbi:MAG TPA: flavin reductase family protein [Nocardioidaceae bacterium]|nr:flavin reductase family protein [Nocardioidaceae bacterium]
MTIHADHPFIDPDRDPVRRLRGRLGGAVTLWTTGSGSGRVGLTVSSVLVAAGEPPRVLGLVDPDSDLAAGVAHTGTAVVALLQWEHRDLADAFAGVAPAPGGVFRLGRWSDTAWGPLLDGVSAWAGIRLGGPGEPGGTGGAVGRQVGWSLLLDGEVERVEIAPEGQPLLHRRGRYQRQS